MRNAKLYALLGVLVFLAALISLITVHPLSASTVGKLIDPDPLSASTVGKLIDPDPLSASTVG